MCSSDLVFVTGPGAEARNSIGLVLVTGMAIGTLFTLYVVPVFYLWIAADHRHRVADPDAAPISPADGHAAAPGAEAPEFA